VAAPFADKAPDRLIALTRDVAFKRAFGGLGSRKTLAHLLNAVLQENLAHEVAHIDNVELKSAQQRTCIFDLACTLQDGSRVIIELQKANMRDEIIPRLVGYQGSAYSNQWKPGGSSDEGSSPYALTPIKMVAIVNFTLERSKANSGSLVQNFSISPRAGVAAPSALKSFQELLDFTVLQLPLAPKLLTPDSSAVDRWAHLLRSSDKYRMSTLPPELREEPYTAAAESACFDSLSPQEVSDLEADALVLHDVKRLEAALERAAALEVRAESESARAESESARAAALEARLNELLGVRGEGDPHRPASSA
jgi:predicted transposase/invertase (TIGR01784 family)